MRLFKYGGDLLPLNLHLNANCDKKKTMYSNLILIIVNFNYYIAQKKGEAVSGKIKKKKR